MCDCQQAELVHCHLTQRTGSPAQDQLVKNELRLYVKKKCLKINLVQGKQKYSCQFSYEQNYVACQVLPRLETGYCAGRRTWLGYGKYTVKDESLSTCWMAHALSDLFLFPESSQGCLGASPFSLLKKPQDLYLAYFEHWFKTEFKN